MSANTAAYTDIRINDDSRFRTQMGWFGTQLESFGWAKQADTGQIDFATVSAPGAANTAMGYEIRKSGSLYMKIEYGSGAYTYSKGFWLTFGTGTDGAGTIDPTKTLLARYAIPFASGYSGGSARAGDDFASGASDRFMLAVTDDTNATYGGIIALEKTHNLLTGDDDDYGWTLAVCHSSNVGGYLNVGTRAHDIDSTNRKRLGVMLWPRAIGDASNVPTSPVWAGHPFWGLTPIRSLYVCPYSLAAFQGTAVIDGRTYVAAYGNNTGGSIFPAAYPSAVTLYARYD